ncbi:hypothetical protein GPECTOR_20g550 [Gonium pectorale]|uniref:Uncharacterized protein n=1 Tax=Gonium pectorale TaxID=33097 RepID=A0A150GIQ9_GONPE|nr:hypothetical protein GPECTOR_20g550 [Gonium pectorale]|eukprot:KXZ49693.1 hypothetical protein GPECTOR_20g550 [Gonium pectorale]
MAQEQSSAREHWSSGVWPQLLPELAERILDRMDRNDIAATFRLVNKATAEHFSGPLHTIIHLSEPVPLYAFAAHWLTPGATRGLTLERRKKLVRLVAASGVLPNLEVALQAVGFVGAARTAFLAAAGAGQLSTCQWLWNHSRGRAEAPLDACSTDDALDSAAGGGHRRVCEWLLSTLHSTLQHEAAFAAARGGHGDLAEWLLRRLPTGAGDSESNLTYLCEMAHGCDLPTLQQTWLRFSSVQTLARWRPVLRYAACSPTPDWAAKVEWLEAQGCPLCAEVAESAAAHPDDGEALARLTWLLRGRGYPVEGRAVHAAACRGNTAALQYLLSEVPPAGNDRDAVAVDVVAEGGHLAALQALHAAGWLAGPLWADEPAALDEKLFAAAAESGSVELLAWLRERSCPWDGCAYQGAAGSGCEAALEWLAERGCPLTELGVPRGPAGSVFLEVARSFRSVAPLPALRWLLEEGCPVDYEDAVYQVSLWWRPNRSYDVLWLLREHLGRRPAG